MIRAEVRAMARDGLWQLVCQQSSVFERGLRVVAEDLDLGTGDLGTVDGLLRDAVGRAVLVFVAEDYEVALPARVFAAYSFWQRNRESLPRAIPEAELSGQLDCRILIVGSRLYPELIDALVKLEIDALDAVEVESFQVSGLDRLAIRNVLVDGGLPAERRADHRDLASLDESGLGVDRVAVDSPLDEEVDGLERELFLELEQTLCKLDTRVQVEGDRFSRRAAFRSSALGEYWYVDGRVAGMVPGRDQMQLRNRADVRVFGDQVMRRYLELLSEDRPAKAVSSGEEDSVADNRRSARRDALEGLRASVARQRLSLAEHEALEEPFREDG